MKKITFFLFLAIILPSIAYELYMPDEYKYSDRNSDSLLFVLDFSNSMGEYLHHETKVNQLKDMLEYILPEISPSTKVGLRVYGHTCNLVAYNACRSSELLVPLGYANSNNILSQVRKLRPRGMTPITYSLKQAVNKDLISLQGNKHIILLTDGGENCDESPCDYSIELVKTKKDIKIDVIAFDVKDSDDLAQLQCTANVTGGRFLESKTKAELLNSVEQLVTPHKEVQAQIYKEN